MKKTIILLLIYINPAFAQHKNEPIGSQNLAYRWAEVALQATANDTERFKPRPTVTSRYLGLIFTAMFDAWSLYENKARAVYAKNLPRQSLKNQTTRNKEIAISYAMYGVLKEYFYSDSVLFKNFMLEIGLNPKNLDKNNNTPEGIGNLVAQAIIEARKQDGSNQYGNEIGSNGIAYFDYTAYKPINSADTLIDINRWQPKYFSDAKGGKFAPSFLTPFWYKVKPITLTSAEQFRPIPPPLVGSEQMKQEVSEVINLQANLSNQQKALVEFMRDGPKSVQQAGHWLKFAQDVSRRDKNNLDTDVKMYFLVGITAMDAFIAAWDSKRFYDTSRPFALVHHYYKNQKITGWKGAGNGIGEIEGENWRPYSPDTFLCPPFASYVSGHSCVSGACAEALKLFTGNDAFGQEAKLIAGAMTEPEFAKEEITLKFTTFTQTAEMAGISRILGGYHIQADNVAGLKLGRDVAKNAWFFYQEHIGK